MKFLLYFTNNGVKKNLDLLTTIKLYFQLDVMKRFRFENTNLFQAFVPVNYTIQNSGRDPGQLKSKSRLTWISLDYITRR